MPIVIPPSDFQLTDTHYMALGKILLKPVNSSLTGVTAAIGSVWTKTGHGLRKGQQVQLVSLTGGTGVTALGYYWVSTVPTADTFTLAATRKGTVIAVSVAASAAVFQPVIVLEATEIEEKSSQQTKEYKRPNGKGVTYVLRRKRVEATNDFAVPVDDVKRLPTFFNGAKTGEIDCLGTVFKPDVDDLPGFCSEVSEQDFPCRLTVDGSIKYGNGEYSKASLKVEVTKNGDLLWDTDVAVS